MEQMYTQVACAKIACRFAWKKVGKRMIIAANALCKKLKRRLVFSKKSPAKSKLKVTFLQNISHNGYLIFAHMAQKKLQRFSEIKTFPNVLEYPENIAGNWNEHFENDNPDYPGTCLWQRANMRLVLHNCILQKNFIGVDVKGNRIWVGAKYALDK